MAWYRAMIRGENFFLDLDERVKRYGFYATRFVEAHSPEDAQRHAVDRIRNDAELRAAALAPKTVEPEIFVEEIIEVESNSVPESKGAGFSFFPAESDA